MDHPRPGLQVHLQTRKLLTQCPGQHQTVFSGRCAAELTAKRRVRVAQTNQLNQTGHHRRFNRLQDFLAVVDYAHKPGALRAVLETLRLSIAGRPGARSDWQCRGAG